MAAHQKKPSPQGKPRRYQSSARPPTTLSRRFQKLARRTYKKASYFFNHFNRRLFLILLAFFVSIAAIATLVWALTNKNAFEVYLGQTKIGIIKKSDGLTPEILTGEAVEKLTDQAGANVIVNETVSFTPVHGKRQELASRSYIVSELSKKFTYQVEAAAITVDGIEMAVVKNAGEAKIIQENIIAQYIQEGSDIVKSGFVEDVQIQPKFVEKGAIITNDDAYTLLTANRDSPQIYTVVAGDSPWLIANSAGLTLDELYELNPSYVPGQALKVGQEMTLVVPTPLLSVITVEKEVYTEVDPKETEQRYNPNQPRSWSRVIQQGKDGQKEVTYHITRINGFPKDKQTMETVPTVASVPEIIEIGTK